MVPILIIFAVFAAILTYYIKKSDTTQAQLKEAFWRKELASNAVRKKDISQLDYITIPFEKIPQKLETSTEREFFSLEGKPMLNLTGISNTDLKLQYGTANLNILSEYDTNFLEFVTILPQYTMELTEAGQKETAQLLLEFAVACKADSKAIYTQLADIYEQEGQSQRIKELLEKAQGLPVLTRQLIEKELTARMER